MPFTSKAQMRACFATKGFHGKVDCDEWAHKTGNTKELPDHVTSHMKKIGEHGSRNAKKRKTNS